MVAEVASLSETVPRKALYSTIVFSITNPPCPSLEIFVTKGPAVEQPASITHTNNNITKKPHCFMLPLLSF